VAKVHKGCRAIDIDIQIEIPMPTIGHDLEVYLACINRHSLWYVNLVIMEKSVL
jgi:hypothetical protein